MAGGRPKGNEISNIPMFDGSSPDPERWLDAVDRVSKTFDWDENRIAKAACLRMEQNASVWLESLVRTKRIDQVVGGTYANFKKEFLARFKPLDEAIKASEAVMDLKMKHGESIAEFGDRITIGVEKKNATWDEATKKKKEYAKARELDMFTFMCAGMDTALRKVVMGGSDPPTTYKDLLKKSITAESALKAKHQIQELVEGMEKASTESNQIAEISTSTNGDTQEAKIAALEKQVEALKEGLRCWNCQELGHTKKDCPKLRGRTQGSQGRGRGFGRGRGGPGRGNWRGNNRGARGNWRGRGFGRGRGYGPPAYFGQPGYYQQQYQPRYPGVQQLNQGPPGFQQQQQYPSGSQAQQQYEIIDMSGNY